ncbi:GerAB/ArcD/ProY family transporter [Fictibacillus aquaticus]|uniref:Spore gernimation protein n=1 Tax=Fictibacillus aquaticus TaxID=2021314 RepID=A0A235F5Y9_9BACL|nr:GerAB/ArcD/ProY family transporter [Fictibacillus aquaticus]OYD56716.1 spore gernimation protein [Fictibacillus aquaticus]
MNRLPADRISTSQTTIILINMMLAAGILTLPRVATEKMMTPDAWIAVIVGGLISMVIALIMVKLCEQYPDKTFYQYNQVIVGKTLGSIISLAVVFYFLLLAALEVRVMAETTGLFLLQGTPIWAIIMPFIWIGLYLTLGGINAVARLLEIIFPITVLFFIVVVFLGLKIFELDNLRPVLGMGIKPIIDGVPATALSYSGYEIILIIYMFMQNQEKAKKVVLIGIGVPLIFYTLTLVVIVGALSVEGVLSQTWPVLTFIRGYEITGLFFERFDSLLLVIWIMEIFSTFIVSYFAVAMGLAQVFKKDTKIFYWGVLPVVYLIAMTPKNINSLFAFGGWISKFGFVLFGTIPGLLLLLSYIRRKNT